MSKIPPMRGREVIRTFEKDGWELVRSSASHFVLKKAGVRHNLSIPIHSGKPVDRNILARAVKLAGLTEDRFLELIDE